MDLSEETPWFPEVRDFFTRLKSTDPHFTRLFDKHKALDEKIRNSEARIERATREEIEVLKKDKLLLTDQLYTLWRMASA